MNAVTIVSINLHSCAKPDKNLHVQRRYEQSTSVELICIAKQCGQIMAQMVEA